MLSERLEAVLSQITEGGVLADGGTDHGYLAIEAVRRGKCIKAIAMDVNKGPLERAGKHIKESQMEHLIETRLSDGFDKLKKGEAASAVIAGMGGRLICGIIERNPDVSQGLKELIISPQSDIEYVRGRLRQLGFAVIDEDMVKEDGKYYVIIKTAYQPDKTGLCDEVTSAYGRKLIEKSHPVLKEYLRDERAKLEGVLNELESAGKRGNERYMQIMHKMGINKKAQEMTD